MRARHLAAGAVAALLGGFCAHAANPPATAPVRDIVCPVLDIAVTTASLDDAVTDTQSVAAETVVLAADVAFAFDRADLSDAAGRTLADVAARIEAGARGVVQIDGYTDAVGAPAYNEALSQRRAQAVAQALQAKVTRAGVSFAAAGHGASDFVAPNTHPDGTDDPAGRARNRRVAVRFDKG